MEKEEFNLSVLENVTSFSSPLKACADYETILSLIKEEIDINTEDETESQKAGKSPNSCKRKDSDSCDSGPRKPGRKSYFAKNRKDSESCDSEGVFKSPYKRKSFPRLKSPVGLFIKRNSDDWKQNGTENVTVPRRTRSLGTLKSGRTFKAHYRKHCASLSRSSETSGLSDSADSILIAMATIENGERTESDTDDKPPFIISNGKNVPEAENVKECNQNSQAINEIPDEKLSDEEFIESSQSTTVSRFRRKLLNVENPIENSKPKAITEMIEKDMELSLEASEAKVPSFISTVSPQSKLLSSAEKEASATPPRPRKRKASVTSPTKAMLPKQEKIGKVEESRVRSLRPRRSKTNAEIPLKSLSQEFEDCIMNSDYQQMSEDIENDMLERTSFTFETIELLNDYNSNPQENNQILSKILTSPAKEIKNEPLGSSENLVDAIIEPTEDPLYIQDNETITAPVASNKNKNLERTPKAKIPSISKESVDTEKCLIQKYEEEENGTNEVVAPSVSKRKKSTARTSKAKKTPISDKSKSTKRQSINERSMEEAERVEEPVPSTSGIKKSTVKTPKTKKKAISEKSKNMEQRLTNESPMEETVAVEELIPSISINEESTTELTEESTTKLAELETSLKHGERRRSARLTEKPSAKISLTDLENDEDLLKEATKLSKKVQAAEKKLALSEETLEKLAVLVVELQHEVLPQHEIETCAGSVTLSYEQQEEFLKYAPLNKDTYNPAEDDIIRENWKAFCEHHDWDPNDYKPFLHLKHGEHLIMSSLEERRKFVQFLANGLPYRPLHSVYSRFKILYSKYAAGGSRYSHKEDMKILAYMLHNPAETPDKKCSELGKVLERSRVSIWKRYKKLMGKVREETKNVLTKVDWTLPVAESFITNLLDVTVSEELIELKDAFIPKVVWLKMQKKMDIHYDVMKRFWEQQLHLQLFSPNPLYLNEIKIMLIEIMYQKKIRHPTEIKWYTIVKYFDGLTIPFLRKTFNHLTAKASMTLGSRNLKSVLKWLYKKEIMQLKDQPKDKCLPRIMYENKKAQILPEDLERIRLCPESLKSD